MEKYRSSADPSTGIHPFIPLKTRRSIFLTALKPVFFILRFPILLVTSLLYALLSLVPFFLSPIPAFSHALHRILDYFLLSLILLTLATWPTSSPHVERPRVRTPLAQSGIPPGRGDIIFVNHASILDILYLARYYSPIFTTPPLVSSRPGDVVRLSLFGALSRVSCNPGKPEGLTVPLAALSKMRQAPIIVLAEGCSSNARGVLRFVMPSIPSTDLPSHTRVFALGLSYSRDHREICVLGSLTTHILHFMTMARASVRARVAAIPSDSPDVQAAVASLAGVPKLSIGYEAGAKFHAHWVETGGRP